MKSIFTFAIFVSILYWVPDHSGIVGRVPTFSVKEFSVDEMFKLPEIANRKGSKRVGGTNSKGKGSRYKGGSNKNKKIKK